MTKRTAQEALTDIAAVMVMDGEKITIALYKAASCHPSYQAAFDDNETLAHCINELNRRFPEARMRPGYEQYLKEVEPFAALSFEEWIKWLDEQG